MCRSIVCVCKCSCVPGGHLETTKEELQHSFTHQERDEPRLHKLVTFRQLTVNIWDVKDLPLLPKVCGSGMETGRSWFRCVCPEYVYSIYIYTVFMYNTSPTQQKHVYACVPLCVREVDRHTGKLASRAVQRVRRSLAPFEYLQTLVKC